MLLLISSRRYICSEMSDVYALLYSHSHRGKYGLNFDLFNDRGESIEPHYFVWIRRVENQEVLALIREEIDLEHLNKAIPAQTP